MQFTRLRLTGFKSFVETAELHIEPGMTGVVGPNGCGKSNLVEALRWVMGETSPKSMRSGGMDDVIFAGTQIRPARNIAEVSLLLDNANRTAPASLNDSDEVEVVRRIEREQGSSYSINSVDVRARDVQTLFADMVTGAHSSALVSQGQIGAMIQAKPTERRSLLEEAAGITGLHSRRHEAELRLRAAETNLERLADHTSTLDTQLRNLKRQVRQATRYANLSGHIRAAEALSLLCYWQNALADLNSADKTLRDIERSAAEAVEASSAANVLQAQAAENIPPFREAEASSAAKLQRLIMERENLDSEVERAAEEIERIRSRLSQTDIDASREESLVKDASIQISGLAKEKAKLELSAERELETSHTITNPEDSIPDISKARNELNNASLALTKAEKNRSLAHHSLTEKHQEAQQFEDSYRKIMAERSALGELIAINQEDLFSPLIDEVSVTKGYESALAAALGDDLQVSGDPNAPSHWRTVSLSEPPLPPGVSSLDNYVDAPSAVKLRLSQIGIVNDKDGNALANELVQGQRLVSKEGALWRWDGFKRAANAKSKEAIKLLQRNRFKELSVEMDKCKKIKDQSQQRLSSVKNDVRNADTAELDARSAVRDADEALSKARENHADKIKEVVARNERAVALKETALARLEAVNDEYSSWKNRVESAQEQILRLNNRRATEQEELTKLESRPKQLEEFRRELLSRIEKSEHERNDAADLLIKAESELADADKASRKASANEIDMREHRVRAESSSTAATQRLEEIATRMKDKIGVEPKDAPEIARIKPNDPLPSIDETESKLARLKKERENMGPVNLLAASEAEELSEQLNRMDSEREDLEGAIRKLRSGIGSLNKEGRERMLAAFGAADNHFQSLFTKLFGGGRAHLKLVDSEDPLEAGLEIYASPPGKRLQTLSLLSGGEQALTAIALRFAVFLTNPAPICVLDEVDAPLDDANVTRYCDLVEEITRQTQTRFLLITHHPQTMARVDRLFGVTMAEQGISQLVSVDLSRAEEMREAS